jgi:pimeloyl-ACP methyl ester carboxylesterase
MKPMRILSVSTAIAIMPTLASSQPNSRSAAPVAPRSGYVSVNGLRMYYELHGAGGTPLVLIHGGGSTIGTNFGRVLPLLSRTRQVIAVEVQAHGHTRDIDRPFTFEQDADDVVALLDSLHVPKADILGFSNGGTTALQIAIRHPGKVNRLVIASSNYRRDGMQEGFWDFMEKGTYADMPQPYKDAYLKINPSQEGVHAMHDRDAKRMLAFKDIPDESIKAIAAPTLVVAGDKDVVRVEHAVQLSRLLPQARLAILPGTHGEYLGEIMTPKVSDRSVAIFADLVAEFLDGRQ